MIIVFLCFRVHVITLFFFIFSYSLIGRYDVKGNWILGSDARNKKAPFQNPLLGELIIWYKKKSARILGYPRCKSVEGS